MAAVQERSRREEYSEYTRLALLDAALEQFAANGYGDTSIDQITQAARVTKGALYHHFEDKRALFDAVVVRLEADLASFVESKSRTEPDHWKRLATGFDAYLEGCARPAFRRVVILDAPAVLGVERFREIDSGNADRLLLAPLAAMRRRGEIDVDDVALVSRLIAAMMWEAAVMMPHARHAKRLKRNTLEFVTRALDVLRKTG